MSLKEILCLVAVVVLTLANDLTPDTGAATSSAPGSIADSSLVPVHNDKSQVYDNPSPNVEPKAQFAQIPNSPIDGKNHAFKSSPGPDDQVQSAKAGFGKPKNNVSVAKSLDEGKNRESSSAAHSPSYLIWVAATTITLMMHGNQLHPFVC